MKGTALEAELDRFPSLQPITKARAEAEAARNLEEASRKRLEAATRRLAEAEAERTERVGDRDRQAADLGLAGWCDALPQLRAATDRYREAAGELLHAAREVAMAQQTLDERQERLDEAQIRAGESQRQRDHARDEAKQARSRAEALSERAGATREQVLVTLRQIDDRRQTVQVDTRKAQMRQSRLDQELGGRRAQVETARQRIAALDDGRSEARDSLVRLARSGILAVVGLAAGPGANGWSLTDALLEARRIQTEAGDVLCDEHAIDVAADRVHHAHVDLTRDVTSGVKVTPRHEDGALVYDVSLSGQPQTLVSLRKAIDTDLSERDRLLAEEEQKLFEQFLEGETHEHLRERLNEAHEMVDKMNAQLARRSTAGGMVLRLAWKPDASAPAGTVEALDLLLRSASLLAQSEREALSTFLRRRLDAARASEAGGSLEARMMSALDYRAWYQFTVEQRTSTGAWKPLTKKVHGTGSGGQKAVMLHLPLFAAAAAFYESARAPAPRLVLLDEAFAGIDRPMRAKLMGLLAEFDLDFVMTSFEEWGFYAELDGIATYQLTREPGFPAVLAERFVWDGGTVREEGVA